MAEAKEKLSKIGRLNRVLEMNSIDEVRFEEAINFLNLNQKEKVEFFAKRVKAEAIKERDFYKIILPSNFPLKLSNFLFAFYDEELKFRDEIESKIFLLSCEIEQESRFDFERDISNYQYSKKRTNGYIIPKREEITKYLLSNNPTKVLIEILSNHISFRDLSPYVTSGGVEKEALFFGRVDIIRNIINKDYTNYLIVGGRQLGKSSLLYALRRLYQKSKNVEVYYMTLNSEEILTEIANQLKIDNSSIDEIIREINRREKKILFLIDEVDKFVLSDAKSGYKITDSFRKLTQERKASFIMAGFWELYHQITSSYQSPLKNFGELVRIGGLEEEACRDLITEPMKNLGISFREGVVDFIIEKCGRRANLIAIICNKVLEKIESREVLKEDIENILENENLDDFLKGWRALSKDEFDNLIDRLIIDVTIAKETFRLKDVVEEFKKLKLDIEIKKIESSLNRLEIAYIYKKRKGNYYNIVPLFKEKLLEGDMDILLEGDIDVYESLKKRSS